LIGKKKSCGPSIFGYGKSRIANSWK